jgi:hypothetical protein
MALVSADNGVLQAVWSDQLAWEPATDELSRRLEFMREVRERNQTQTVVACERFTINPQTSQRGQGGVLDAIGMIGVARYICGLTGVEMATLQMASAAKNLVKNDTLKALGLHAPGLVHVQDAFRHAVLLLVARKWIDPRSLLPAKDTP